MLAYVIGSGPSGVSVASALLKDGHQVVMLDYGNQVSKFTLDKVNNLANTPIPKWTESLLSFMKRPINKKFPDKLIYGEDYPYRDGIDLLNISSHNCGFVPSLARGGHSNVWGSAVLPMSEKHLANWPITRDELLPHYAAVAEFMAINAKIDGLIDTYPLYGPYLPGKIAPQIKQVYEKFLQNEDYCEKEKISYGYARTAYNTVDCRECGLCMRGCPFGLIYNSSQTVAQLMQNENFKYIDDILVEEFVTVGDQVKILAVTRNKEKTSFIADKLFLATGVLATSKIVLTSLKSEATVYLKEAPYFIAPVFSSWLNGKNTLKSDFPTLAQIFVEINDKKICADSAHFQVYPYNEMLLEKMKDIFGYGYFLVAPLVKWLLSKTIVIQGFFHSNEGKPIEIKLVDGKLNVTGYDTNLKPKIKLLLNKFKKIGFPYALQIATPGRSFHCGGTFPMVADINAEDRIVVDTNGLLKGTQNVHIVDASILSDIPGQKITYTVMANAHRIGSLFKGDN